MNELNIIKQTLYELESQHSKVRQQYEEEVNRLRNELAQARQVFPLHRRRASNRTSMLLVAARLADQASVVLVLRLPLALLVPDLGQVWDHRA